MVSKVLAQIAEEPAVLDVYNDLFSEEGSEIYLKPIDLYFNELPENIMFIDLMHLAQKRNEVLLGYRFIEKENDVGEKFGVQINNPKTQIILPKSGDQLIVLSENEL